MGYTNGGSPPQSNYYLKGFEIAPMGVEPALLSPSSLFNENLFAMVLSCFIIILSPSNCSSKTCFWIWTLLWFRHASSLFYHPRASFRKLAFVLNSHCIPVSQSPKGLINYPVKLSLTEFEPYLLLWRMDSHTIWAKAHWYL